MPGNDKDKGKAALAIGATGTIIGVAALIALLTRKVEAAPPGEIPPTDEEIRQALAAILGQQVTTLDNIEAIIKKLVSLEEAIIPKPVKREQIPFAYNLASLQGVTLTEYAPFSGYIKEVSIHWPAGCNALVDVMVGHGQTQFCPREGFLALDDATPTYDPNERIDAHEEIWVKMQNTDGLNPHNITVTIILEGEA